MASFSIIHEFLLQIANQQSQLREANEDSSDEEIDLQINIRQDRQLENREINFLSFLVGENSSQIYIPEFEYEVEYLEEQHDDNLDQRTNDFNCNESEPIFISTQEEYNDCSQNAIDVDTFENESNYCVSNGCFKNQINKDTIDLTDDDIEEVFCKEPCPICMRNCHLISTKCKHTACLDCWESWFKKKTICPFCRKFLTIKDSFVKVPISKMNLILEDRKDNINQIIICEQFS